MPDKRKPPMIRLAQWNISIEYSTSELRDAKTRAYEDRVHVIVNAIAHTNIGKCLLKTLHDTRNPDAGVWIMPRASTEDYCNARTGNYYGYTNGKPTSYKGSRIQYSPERYDLDDCGWYPGMRPEEVLFHEMVHASRDLNNGVTDDTPLELMDDYEEFLALVVTNMFRSERGAKKLHRNYILKELVSQEEAELFLSSKRQYIQALDILLSDPLVMAVVKLPMPFNPFRDIERIKANHSDILELLNDLNPLAAPLEAQRLNQVGKKLTEMRDLSINSSSRAINHQ
jgi:hypothetical protein